MWPHMTRINADETGLVLKASSTRRVPICVICEISGSFFEDQAMTFQSFFGPA